MKVTAYLKNGVFVQGEVAWSDFREWKRKWNNLILVHLKNPDSTIVVSEITHIIEQPNQTENT